MVAFHESGHALVGWLLEHTDAVMKVGGRWPGQQPPADLAQDTPRGLVLREKEACGGGHPVPDSGGQGCQRQGGPGI